MMKNICYTLFVLLLFTSATCRKAQPETALSGSISGKWKYLSKIGGYAGKTILADPNTKQILQFKSGSRYLQKVNDEVSEQGSYELSQVKSIYSGKEAHAIRFSSKLNPSQALIISLSNDT